MGRGVAVQPRVGLAAFNSGKGGHSQERGGKGSDHLWALVVVVLFPYEPGELGRKEIASVSGLQTILQANKRQAGGARVRSRTWMAPLSVPAIQPHR